MNQHMIDIEESDNPDYYRLLHEAEDLQGRWHLLYQEIHDIYLKKGKIKLSLAKSRMRSLYPDVKTYIQDCLEWKKRASNFLVKPNLIVTSSEKDQQLGFLMGLENLRDTIQRISHCVEKTEQNYNGLMGVIENQTNFNLAIASVIISLLGLILSLCT